MGVMVESGTTYAGRLKTSVLGRLLFDIAGRKPGVCCSVGPCGTGKVIGCSGPATLWLANFRMSLRDTGKGLICEPSRIQMRRIEGLGIAEAHRPRVGDGGERV
jgi:hypothetical protein